MKWYFAINEAGATGGLGLHARLAVISARRVGGLSPHLLYMGARNAFTAWMEAQGVTVIDTAPTFLPAIEQAAQVGRHPAHFVGHWLRTRICLLEPSDAFVLYTDCDVIFRRCPDLAQLRPAFIACAPEFRPDNWKYFNSGVMLMNVAALRREYAAFERYVIDALGSPERAHFDDQVAYNQYFETRWTHADPALNWKPYWGFHDRAVITHYHGPKLEGMRIILNGGLAWDDEHCRMHGSLFVTALPSYIAHLQDLLAILADAAFEGREVVERILHDAEALRRVVQLERIDLSFMAD
jgi:hypothetical protein